MSSKSKPVLTEASLVRHLETLENRILEKVDIKLEDVRRNLEFKIEFSRTDAREQLLAMADGLNRKMDGVAERLDKKIDEVDKKHTQRIGVLSQTLDAFYQEFKATREEFIRRFDRLEAKFDRLLEIVERHDRDIALLKASASHA